MRPEGPTFVRLVTKFRRSNEELGPETALILESMSADADAISELVAKRLMRGGESKASLAAFAPLTDAMESHMRAVLSLVDGLLQKKNRPTDEMIAKFRVHARRLHELQTEAENIA